MLADYYNYWVVIILMMIGFYIVISDANLIKKIIGLTIFQTSVFILFISMGKVDGGTAPILVDTLTVYSNPLPHVLILTAIVVGVATTALGLAIIARIHRAYGSVDENVIHAQDEKQEKA
ncbi:MAG: cation:proton antiporter subunit C [Gammaproteobacteria bacterium]|jgi:multicomponent Na+:H+ antiporter subunit C|nr:cation:proton antiporter subunit C [Gammaproteobacteria bacterium]